MNDQRPSVLIPIAPGTNRNDEMALAFEAVGAKAAQYPLNAIREGETQLADHQLLALPGGFSYGDALGAGRILGLDLAGWFADQLREAQQRQMPIIGICNGFQALVHAGLLPGTDASDGSLLGNASARFECRWVYLEPSSARSPWTAGLTEPLWCPVAHGEGRFSSTDVEGLTERDQIAFRYADSSGTPAGGAYPLNPNGSVDDIAGICDETGLVLGMMPHPEDHIIARQSPDLRRHLTGLCTPLFSAGVKIVTA